MFDRLHPLGRALIAWGLLWRILLCEGLALALIRGVLAHLPLESRPWVAFGIGVFASGVALAWLAAAGFGPYRLRYEVSYPEFLDRPRSKS